MEGAVVKCKYNKINPNKREKKQASLFYRWISRSRNTFFFFSPPKSSLCCVFQDLISDPPRFADMGPVLEIESVPSLLLLLLNKNDQLFLLSSFPEHERCHGRAAEVIDGSGRKRALYRRDGFRVHARVHRVWFTQHSSVSRLAGGSTGQRPHSHFYIYYFIIFPNWSLTWSRPSSLSSAPDYTPVL